MVALRDKQGQLTQPKRQMVWTKGRSPAACVGLQRGNMWEGSGTVVYCWLSDKTEPLQGEGMTQASRKHGRKIRLCSRRCPGKDLPLLFEGLYKAKLCLYHDNVQFKQLFSVDLLSLFLSLIFSVVFPGQILLSYSSTMWKYNHFSGQNEKQFMKELSQRSYELAIVEEDIITLRYITDLRNVRSCRF